MVSYTLHYMNWLQEYDSTYYFRHSSLKNFLCGLVRFLTTHWIVKKECGERKSRRMIFCKLKIAQPFLKYEFFFIKKKEVILYTRLYDVVLLVASSINIQQPDCVRRNI